MSELILNDIFIEQEPTEDQLEEQLIINYESTTKDCRDRKNTVQFAVTDAVHHWLTRTAENADISTEELLVRLVTASMDLTAIDLAAKGWRAPS